MTFVCANVNEGLPFADGSFDLIVCKASLDAILQQQNNARHMMAECHRLLKDNATTTVSTTSTSTLLLTPTMICITHGNPESRLVHFENPRDEWWDNVGIFALANNNNNKHGHAHQGSKYVQIYMNVCVVCVYIYIQWEE
jgi:ubiquinone/menaquinone biosynthesis C-methylase UbiE